MNKVRLGTNPRCSDVRRQRARLLLFERDRFRPHSPQTGHQKRSAEPLAIDLAVYLFGRFFNAKAFKQSSKLLVADATARHLELYQLLRDFFPDGIRPEALVCEFVHLLLTEFKLHAPISSGSFWGAILGRIRLVAKRQHYTSSESNFCEDRVLSIHLTDPFGIRLSIPAHVPGGAL